LIRNLSIAGKRKRAGKFAYDTVKPEIILLQENLDALNLTLDQLIVLAILVGTDYNPAGIKGIGPKKGLKLLQEFGSDFEKIFETVKWNDHYEISWKEIFDTIKDMPVTDDYKLEWGKVEREKLTSFLVDRHEFSLDRVNSKLDKLEESREKNTQKGLGSFF